MFYEVRILTPKGDLKKVVSTQELSKIHWRTFNEIKLFFYESEEKADKQTYMSWDIYQRKP